LNRVAASVSNVSYPNSTEKKQQVQKANRFESENKQSFHKQTLAEKAVLPRERSNVLASHLTEIV
jgi:hypothetical protein